MNTKPAGNSPPIIYPAKSAAKTNAFGVRLAVTPDCNLHQEVMKAFHLAKSAGQELELTFIYSLPVRRTAESAPPRLLLSAPIEPPTEKTPSAAPWLSLK
jgi:hypothetical protein